MNILSLITHPRVVPNLYKFLSYVEHKEDILKSQAVFPIDFYSIYFPTVEVNGTIHCSITSIFLNIFFYVEHKKETNTVLEWHEGK